MSTVSQTPPLPGFGLPLGLLPCERIVAITDDGVEVELVKARGEGKPLFQSALYHRARGTQKKRPPLLTLREIAMLECMNDITDKPGWESKIFDTDIAEKWNNGLLVTTRAESFTPAMADYCVDELGYKAELYQKTGAVSLFNGDVVKADNCVTLELKNALRAAVAVLEKFSDQRKEWHLGSNGSVIDLVHPSQYPLVYGLTRIVPDSVVNLETCLTKSGHGEIIPVPPETETLSYRMNFRRTGQKLYSNKFQWLPCDLDISGEAPRIVSYINNLQPQQNAGLYIVIEKIVGKVIPLWNLTLSPLRDFVYRRRISVCPAKYLKEYLDGHGPRMEEGQNELDFVGHESDFTDSTKPRPTWHIPDVGTFTRPEALKNPVDLRADYGHRGIQIIVKLASVYLTPENPKYGGEVWNVEGQLNEHICASALYYFDDENITTSHLAFRQAADTAEIKAAQDGLNGAVWLETIFGCTDSAPAVQQVGSIETREGRVITFPNLLQHQVQPFELVDPTKPGHRKILALFLVDPHIRIISTANVPCQQRDWWSQAISDDVNNRLAKLPPEIYENIIDEVGDFPISLEAARRLREELIEERKSLTRLQDEIFFEIEDDDDGVTGFLVYD